MASRQTEKEFFKSYNIHDFDVPLTSVEIGVFTIRNGQLQVLLVKRNRYPAMGQWALPGEFIDLKKDKTLEHTALRKIRKKTGVEHCSFEQVETFGSSDRDPRGWAVTVAYLAIVACNEMNLKNEESDNNIQWVDVHKVSECFSLAFDHQRILQHCYERLVSKSRYTSLPVGFLPDEFTLSELQNTFEIVLGHSIEKKSFRRRMIEADILQETGSMKEGSNRPAKLYYCKQKNKLHLFSRNIEGTRETS